MRQIVFLVLFFSVTSIVAQRVGVNINVPEVELDVRAPDDASPATFRIANPTNTRFLELFSGSDIFPDPVVFWKADKSLLFANDGNGGFEEIMRIDPQGDIGIKITNPEAALDIRGGDWNLDAGNPGDVRIGNSTHNLRIGVATGGGGAGITRIYSSSHLILGSVNEPQMQIDTDGETGFGTNNPNQKVHVNGKLKIGDDGKAPTEGTMRYNSTNKSFEGYDGSKWIKLGGSGPYGVSSDLNLPDNSSFLSIDGNITIMRAVEDWVVVKSIETVQTGWDSNFPPNPIYSKFVYVNLFQKNGAGDWINQLSLSENGGSQIFFNYASDLALSSNRLLIGDPQNNRVLSYGPGASSGQPWVLEHTYTSPDNSIDEYFGAAVDIHNDEIIIGAPAKGIGFSVSAEGPGKAYIYDENHTLQATLSGPGATIGDEFGYGVAIAEDRAIVGAPGKNFAANTDAGAVTVFNKFSGNWSTNNTFYAAVPVTNGKYGYNVKMEDRNYFYVQSGEGIDAYLVENGFWILKETINLDSSLGTLGSFRVSGNDKLALLVFPQNLGLSNYVRVYERDANNFLNPVSTLIHGNSEIQDFKILNNELVSVGKNAQLYSYLY